MPPSTLFNYFDIKSMSNYDLEILSQAGDHARSELKLRRTQNNTCSSMEINNSCSVCSICSGKLNTYSLTKCSKCLVESCYS